MNETGVIVRPSNYTYSETVARLTVAITDHGATIFAVIDHAANAASVGIAMPSTAVIILGNPKVGTPLMLESPNLAIELPGRILIRNTAMNTTEVAWIDAAALAERYGLDDASGLAGLLRIVDQTLDG